MASPRNEGAGGAASDGTPRGPDEDAWLKRALGLDPSAYDAVADTADTWLKKGKMLVGMDPDPTPGVGKLQSTRAEKNLEDMPDEDRKKVKALLADAPEADKPYLRKALASGHSADEIAAFENDIKDKDADWKQKNLHLVGDSDGGGIRQQWHDSCQATVTEAVKGEMDPVYALKTRQQNPDVHQADPDDGAAANPALGREQRDMLEYGGGKAVPRADEAGGRDAKMSKMLNAEQSTTGVTYENTPVTPKNVDEQMAAADKELANGVPIPIRLASADDKQGHAALITGVDPGPPRTYSIHDPWDGTIVKVTDQQIKENKVGIQGYGRLSDFYHPSPAKD